MRGLAAGCPPLPCNPTPGSAADLQYYFADQLYANAVSDLFAVPTPRVLSHIRHHGVQDTV